MEDLAGHQTGDRPVADTHERMSGGGLSSSPSATTERRTGAPRALPFRPSTRTPSCALRSGDAARARRNRSGRDGRARTPALAARALLALGCALALGAAPAAAQMVSIDDAETYEGSAASTVTTPVSLDFTVSLDQMVGQDVVVSYTIAPGTTNPATAGTDYDNTITSGTVTFPANDTTPRTISVPVTGDDVLEDDETLTVTLTGASGGASVDPGAGEATGTILADDFWIRFGRKEINSQRVYHAGDRQPGYTPPDSYAISFAEGESQTTTFLGTMAHLDLRSPGGGVIALPTSGTIEVVLREESESTATRGGLASERDYEIVPDDLTFVFPNPAAGLDPNAMRPTDDEDDAWHYDSFLTIFGDTRREPDEKIALRVDSMTLFDSNGVEVPNAALTTRRPSDNFDFDGIDITLENDATDMDEAPQSLPDLRIDPTSVTEGAPGETPSLTFTVSLTEMTNQDVTVDYTVTDITTQAGVDYGTPTPASPVTIGMNTLSTTITVPVTGDDEIEGDETMRVTLSNPSIAGITIAQASASGAILNDDFPTLSIHPASVTEGAPGETPSLTFTVELSETVDDQDVTVDYAVTGVTAQAGVDYGTPTPASPVTIGMGTTSTTITVPVTGDAEVERDETVRVTLSNPSIAGITFAQASETGTILNDDLVDVAINSPSVLEGDAGTQDVEFEVTLREAVSEEVTVAWRQTAGSAAANSDYQFSPIGGADLTFAPGDTSKTFTVRISGDTAPEPDETAVFTISNPRGPARIATSTGTLTILNDDTTLTFNLGEAFGEGIQVTDEDFELVADPPLQSGHEVRVDYRVVPGTAPGEATLDDIQSGSTGSFHITSTKATSSLRIRDDSTIEPHETVTIELFNPRGATLAATRATLTIVDDDGGAFTLAGGNNYEYAEGRAGATTPVEVELVLNQALPEDITIRLEGPPQQPGLTGTYGSDFTLPAGISYEGTTGSGDQEAEQYDGISLLGTIPAGDLSGTFTVATILGDDSPEGDENDRVRIGTVFRLPGIDRNFQTGGTGAHVNFVIRNDDHNLSIGSPSVTEGDMGGTAELVFEVAVSNSPPEVTLQYEVHAASTTAAASDYGTPSPAGGTLTIPANSGTATTSITVPVTGDALVEPDETVAIRVFSPSGEASSLFIPDSVIGIGTITNDDHVEFSIVGGSVDEGATGTTAMLPFTVTLSEPLTSPVSVDYFGVAGGTADINVDYVAFSAQTLTFARGETEKTVRVTVRGDNQVEPDETVLVRLSSPTGGTRIRSGMETGTGTIRNDDRYIFSISGGSVLEGDDGGTADLPFTVTLNQAATGTLTVDYEDTGNGSAVLGTDYNAFSRGTLTFMAGETSKSFAVTVPGDGNAEAAVKTVEVRLLNPSGNSELGTSTAAAEIRDDDIPVLSIDSPSVDEGDAGDTVNLVFTASLDRAALGDVTFPYTVGGNADSSDHGTIAPASPVTIPMGMTSAAITVPVTGDDVPEDDETVTITITSAPSGITLSTQSVGRGTITNDDFPAITAGGTVPEGAAGASTTLTLGLDAPLPGREVTVDWTVTMASTAMSGTDYTGTTSGTARFPAGATTVDIGVTVLGNDLDQDDRTIVVGLSSASGATLAAPEGTFTIRDDDDPPTISIVPRAFASNRPDGAGRLQEIGINTPITFEISLDAASGKTVTADFSYAGTAIRGTENLEHDYTIDGASGGLQRNTGADSGTVTFAPGQTEKMEHYITVNGNDVPEPVKTVILLLTNVRNAVPVNASGTLTIVDDDGVTVEAQVVGQASREEADGQIEFRARLSNDYPYDQPATVDWTLSGMATIADGDYTSASGTSGTFTFERDDREKRITIQMREDTTVEADETVVFTLSNPATTAVGDFDLHSNAAATFTIENDDFPLLSVTDTSVTEGDSGTADLVFTVMKTPATAFATGTVTYSRTDGTATAGTDFTALPTGTLTFGPNDASQRITVEVTGDDLGELDETVIITLSAPRDLSFGSENILEPVGTIIDDDDLTLSITGPSAPVDEGDSGTTQLPFALTLDAPSSLPVTVDWALSGDVDAEDFPAATGTFTIPANMASATLNVPVTGDGTVERDETATVTLSNPNGNGVSVGFAGNVASVGADATVRNDDFATVSVAPAMVNEGDVGQSPLSFAVSLDRPSDLPVEIGYELLATSTAVSGEDFVPPAAGPLTIPAGSMSETFEIQARGDTILEPDETVVVRFTVQQPTPVEPPATSLVSFAGGAASGTATGTIRNDDTLTVTFDPPLTPAVDEGDAGASTTLAFTVRLSGESAATATVNVLGDNSTATLNADYATPTKDVVFPPGVQEMDYVVIVTGDGEDEPDETVVLELNNPSDGLVEGSDNELTLTIRDDDVPELAVDSPAPVDEGDVGDTPTITFTVTMDRAAHQEVTVAYDVAGTADDDDFTSAPTRSGTLSFGVGDTSKTLSFTVDGDGDAEGNETVIVTLSNPTGGARLATSTGETTITNDDDATLTISSPTVPEGDSGDTTDLEFVVTLSPEVPMNAVVMNWTVLASSTEDGVTYTDGRSDSITFAAGETSKTITVEVTGDDDHGPDRMVFIDIAHASGPAQVLNPRGTGTIQDDDEPELSVTSVQVDEGATGTTAELAFEVTLSGEPYQAVTVDWRVTGTPATEADDWVGGTQPVGGTVTFAAGETATSALVGTVRGDDVGEDNETLMVEFSNPTGDAFLAGGGATIDVEATITNDDFPEITVDSPSVAEGASGTTATFEFTVTLDPVSDRQVTVGWGRAGGSADEGTDPGDDYTFDTSPPGTLTFAPGESSKTIGVTVAGDDTAEPNETVLIQLANLMPAGGHVTFPGGEDTLQGTGTITNDDSITVSVTAPGDVDEGGAGDMQTLEFTVGLSTATGGGTVGVRYEVITTADGDDFIAQPSRTGTLSFAPNEDRKTLSFTVRGDEDAEPDEAVEVRLSQLTLDDSPVGADLITLGVPSASFTIRNDDFPALTVASPAPVTEGDDGASTDLVFTLSLDRPSYEPVSVAYTPGGTAMDGTDYGTPTPASPLMIPTGSRTLTVTVPVRGDTEVEGDETVTLMLSSLSGGAARFPGNATTLDATGTIRDDDIPLFRISSPAVPEGASGTRASMLVFEVSVDPAATGSATVAWRVTGGSATAGEDYEPLTPDNGTFTFAPGGAPRSIPAITVLGDDDAEPNETVEITLSSPVGAQFPDGGSTFVGMGTIQNDDSITLSVVPPADVDEGDTGTQPLEFTFELSSATTGRVSARYEVSGTADFAPGARRSGPLDFAGSASSISISLPVRGDREAEPDETVTVTLFDLRLNGGSVPDGGPVTLGTASATVTIRNDDFPELTVDSPSVLEGASGTTPNLVFTLTMDRADYAPVTVEYAVTGADSDDYGTPVPSSPVTIPVGRTTAEITVPVTGDSNVEQDETVTLTLSNLQGGAVRFPGGAGTLATTGTIENDDIPLFSITSPRVTEGDPGDRATMTFTVSLDPAATGTATVAWNLLGSESTATAGGVDYTATTTSGTLTFTPPGSPPQTIDVTVHGDEESERNETVVIELTNPTGGAEFAGEAQSVRGIGRIDEDDLPLVSIDSPMEFEGNAGEEKNLTFTVSMSVASPFDEDVWVDWEEVTASSSATRGTDYTLAPSGRVMIPAGATSTTIPATVRGDGEREPDETVVIRIDTGGNQQRVILDDRARVGVGTIIDDDIRVDIDFLDSPNPYGVPLDPPDFENPYRVPEGASGTAPDLVFTVSLVAGATSSGDVTVQYELAGTARLGDDYGTPSPANRLTIPAGSTSTEIRIPVTGDREIENDETVTVRLTDSEGAGIRTVEATGTILNDDVPLLTVASSSVAEGDSGTTQLPFTVTPMEAIPDDVTVTYRYVGVPGSEALGEADGLDFELATNTFQIAFGEDSVEVPVTVFGDFEPESHEDVVVRFLNPVEDVVLATGTGTIMNDDDDPLPELTVAAASLSVPEGNAGGASTTLTFTLTLSASSSEDVTVNYQDEPDGTATRGDDYLFPAPAGVHVIETGATTTELVVEIVGDDVAEPDETVTILFWVAEGATIPGDDTITATIENDDDLLLSVDSPSVLEGASGASTTLTFTVSLSGVNATASTTVEYDLGGTATEGDDYEVVTPSPLEIAAGATSTSLEITVKDDDDEEEDERVTVTLRAPSDGAAVSGEPGVGIILDDDELTLSIEPVTAVEEGALGASTTLTFTVNLSASSADPVTFVYRVISGTARRGVDYDPTFLPEGTITIPAGQTSATIEVPVLDDDYGEPDDDLVIEISEPTAGRIRTGMEKATGTIQNDPADPVAVSVIGSESDGGEAVFTVGVYPEADHTELVRVFYLLEGGTLKVERTVTRAVGPDVRQAGSCSGRSIDIPMGRLAEIRAVPDAGTVSLTVTCASGRQGVYAAHAGKNTAAVSVAGRGFTADEKARNTKALAHVLAGIGRTVVANVVDLIWERAASHRSGGRDSYAMVGGRSLDTGAFAAGGGAEDGADALRAVVDLAGDLFGVETDSRALLRDAERRLARGEGLGALGDWVDLPDSRDLAGNTRFAVSFQDGAAGDPRGYTVWGRGSLKAFESRIDDETVSGITTDGDVIVGNLGLDYRLREDLLVGAVLSHAMGDVDYSFGEGQTGAVDTTLTSVHPYVHWISPTGLGLWGSVGYGAGTADLKEAGQTDSASTDITMHTLAGGIRDELARVDEVDIAFKADIFSARTTGDGSAGVQDVDADVSRVRLAFEGSTRHELERGRFLTGRFELGTRFDGGDAERGAGIDIAGGFTYAIPELGLDVQGRGSMLLLHEESGFEQWGLGFGVIWDPDEGDRGLSLSIEPVWNTPVANTANAMWNAKPGSVGTGGARDGGASLKARLGYGMGAFGDRALVTVFGELGNVGGDERLRLGTAFRGPRAGGSGLGLELYGERRDRPQGPDDSVFLKGRLGF